MQSMIRAIDFRRLARLSQVSCILLALNVLAAGQAGAWSSGPPDGFCGDPPGFTSCTACHGSNVGDGSLQLIGLPAGGYTPGANYALTVRLADPGQSRWGFELTALEDATLHQAGTLIATDAVNTQLSDNPDPDADYLKHTSQGTHAGTPDGPTTWTFAWVAPAAGSVTFYVAGNAANNNGAPSGDFIYLINRQIAPATTGIDPEAVPAITFLGSSFPNPAPTGAAASVRFALGTPSQVVLRIVDASGRFIAQPLDDALGVGPHLVTWNGRTTDGRPVPRGVYFMRLDAAGKQLMTRLVVN